MFKMKVPATAVNLDRFWEALGSQSKNGWDIELDLGDAFASAATWLMFLPGGPCSVWLYAPADDMPQAVFDGLAGTGPVTSSMKTP